MPTQSFGAIQSIRMEPGTSSSHSSTATSSCTIVFQQPEAAAVACATMNGFEIAGRRIRVTQVGVDVVCAVLSRYQCSVYCTLLQHTTQPLAVPLATHFGTPAGAAMGAGLLPTGRLGPLVSVLGCVA
jgi:hypothetical protein